jgi:hypothetical protein
MCETTTSKAMSDDFWTQKMQPIIDRHFTADEQQAFQARKFSFAQAEVSQAWDALIAEARALQVIGDASSRQAADLARRWMAQVKLFAGEDPSNISKAAQVNVDALADPETAPNMPFDLSLMQFVSEAYRAAGKA